MSLGVSSSPVVSVGSAATPERNQPAWRWLAGTRFGPLTTRLSVVPFVFPAHLHKKDQTLKAST